MDKKKYRIRIAKYENGKEIDNDTMTVTADSEETARKMVSYIVKNNIIYYGWVVTENK